jgi:hypothetical protein
VDPIPVEVLSLKYLIIQEMEQPYEENMRRAFEIEAERREKGISIDDIIIFPHHAFLTEWKWFTIVETDDPLRIAKWEVDHAEVKKYKVIPIIESIKMYELGKDRWKKLMEQ